MGLSSPTLEGFRASFRRPYLTIAEIAWRWTFGAVAGSLIAFGFIEFLDSLPVTRADATLLRTRQPVFLSQAIGHIFRGSLDRAVFAGLLAVLSLLLLWIVLASIGRITVVCALLEYFRDRAKSDVPPCASGQAAAFRRMASLQFLRSALGVAALLGILGAGVVSGLVSSEAKPRVGLVILIFFILCGLIGILWFMLNWLLGVASIFIIRDSQDALSAISSTVAFTRERIGAVGAVSTWMGLAHIAIFGLVFSAIGFPMALMSVVPVSLATTVIGLLTLAYFAAADWLHLARIAGYVYIAETPDFPAASQHVSYASSAAAPGRNTIDKNEPILGDSPDLALET